MPRSLRRTFQEENLRKLIPILCIAAFAASSAAAQTTPKAEVFGGYSYFRFNGQTSLGGGWHGSVAGNFNKWFGVVGEFSGHYGNSPSGAIVRLHTITFGPRLSFRQNEKVTVFTHFTYGFAQLNGATANYGALTLGVGADIKATDRVAIRAGQFDYVVTGFGIAQQHFRYSGGVVFRFGSK